MGNKDFDDKDFFEALDSGDLIALTGESNGEQDDTDEVVTTNDDANDSNSGAGNDDIKSIDNEDNAQLGEVKDSDDTISKDDAPNSTDNDGTDTIETSIDLTGKIVDEDLNSIGIESYKDVLKMKNELDKARASNEVTGEYGDKIAMLKETGVDDKSLALALLAVKGDKNAIAKMLEQNSIDPIDLIRSEEDDPIDESGLTIDITKAKGELGKDRALAYLETTKTKESFLENIGSRWDESSVGDILSNGKKLEVISRHLSDGTYDKVVEFRDAMLKKDFSGELSKMTSIELYSKALTDLYSKQQVSNEKDLNGNDSIKSETVEPKKEAEQSDVPDTTLNETIINNALKAGDANIEHGSTSGNESIDYDDDDFFKELGLDD